MTKFLKMIVLLFADIHALIVQAADRLPFPVTDKTLHFLVIGVCGALTMLVVYPLFRYLIRRGHVFTVCWLFTVTFVTGMCFAIEVGQQFSGTGNMDVADVVSGVLGFFALSLIPICIRVLHKLLRGKKKIE